MALFDVPRAWVIGLVCVFAILPVGMMALLVLRSWFNRKMFGRVYVWDRPWSVISEDARVHETFGWLRLGVLTIVAVMMVSVGALIAFV